MVGRPVVGLLHRVDELGRGAEECGTFLLGIGEEGSGRRWMEGRAVEEEQRRARGKPRHQPVPHHPAERGEVEDAIACADGRLQAVLLEVLDERAADRMDDAFRHARGAGREQDIERVGEGHARIGDGLRREGRQRGGERNGIRQRRGDALRLAEEGHDDGALQTGKLGDDLRELLGQMDFLAGIAIAVDGEEHLGRDLAEAVDNRVGAEIGRGRRPHGTQRSGGQRRRDRLGRIGEQAGDMIADAHAGGRECLLKTRNQIAQLAPGEATGRSVLAAKDDCIRIVGASEQVLGEVQARIGKEAGAGHPLAIFEKPFALVADDAAEIPDEVPEGGTLVDRPGVQRAVIGEAPAGALGGLRGEAGQRAGGNGLAARLPQRRFTIHGRALLPPSRRARFIDSARAAHCPNSAPAFRGQKFLAVLGISSYPEMPIEGTPIA